MNSLPLSESIPSSGNGNAAWISTRAAEHVPGGLVAHRADLGPAGGDVGHGQRAGEVAVVVPALVADQVDLDEPGPVLIPVGPGPDRDLGLQQRPRLGVGSGPSAPARHGRRPDAGRWWPATSHTTAPRWRRRRPAPRAAVTRPPAPAAPAPAASRSRRPRSPNTPAAPQSTCLAVDQHRLPPLPWQPLHPWPGRDPQRLPRVITMPAGQRAPLIQASPTAPAFEPAVVAALQLLRDLSARRHIQPHPPKPPAAGHL